MAGDEATEALASDFTAEELRGYTLPALPAGESYDRELTATLLSYAKAAGVAQRQVEAFVRNGGIV